MLTETIQTTILVPTIRCGGCAESISTALNQIDGVKAVDVDVPTKAVTVEHSPHITRESLAMALDKAGFPAA